MSLTLMGLLLLFFSAGVPLTLKGQAHEKQSLIGTHDEDGFIHFQLELISEDKREELSKAVDVFERLENYRFVNERRRIRLGDGLGFVVLYSAQELMSSSGRRIRPQNIHEPSLAPEVQFVLTEQSTIKEIVTDQ